MTAFLALVLLGAVLALDGTSVGQFMVSRPLVSAPLGAWVAGADPATALLVGGILELFFLPSVAAGGARFLEPGPGGVVGGATLALAVGPGGLAAAVLLGLVSAEVGGTTISALRRANERLAPPAPRERVSPGRLTAGHLGAVALDFIRGGGVTGVGLLAAVWIAPWAVPLWPLSHRETLGLLLLLGAVPLGLLWTGIRGGARRRRWLLLAGLLGGLMGGMAL